jgi:glycosyl transferase family 25
MEKFIMKIYIINVEKMTERLEKIILEFKKYNFTNYVIVKAYDSNIISESEIKKNYSEEKALKNNRKLSYGEICCSLSHQKAYQQIIEQNENFAIVIEDDCVINENLINLANNFTNNYNKNFDIVLLSYYSSNLNLTKNSTFDVDNKYVCNNSAVFFKNEFIDIHTFKAYKLHEKSFSIDFIHGSHCYLISKNGCKKILNYNFPVFLESDNVWNHNYSLNLYAVNPLINNVSLFNKEHSSLEKERFLIMADFKNYSKKLLKRINHKRFSN